MPLPPEDFRRRSRFIIKLGRALHGCGASSDRIELHLKNSSAMLGLNASFLISPTTFTCAFWEEDELDQFIHIERVEASEYNLGRLWEVDQLVEALEMGKLSLEEGLTKLGELQESPKLYSPALEALSWALPCFCFALLLSQSIFDSSAAGLIALCLFFLVRFTSSRPAWRPVTIIIAAFFAGFLGTTLQILGYPVNPGFIILSSIIIFIPGLPLTVALTEISAGHLISGSSRVVDAMMMLLKLFFGTWTGVAIAQLTIPASTPVIDFFGPLPGWRVWPALVGFSVSLGIVFNVPKKRIIWGFFSVIIAFICAQLGAQQFGTFSGMFIGALAVGLYANIFSRLTRGPGSVLSTFGIIVLVPGSKVYAILNHWVSGETILPDESAGKAVMAFVAILVGLLFSNAILPARKSL